MNGAGNTNSSQQKEIAMRQLRFAAATILAASTLGACATKGFVRKGLESEAEARRVAIEQEKTERTQGDDALRSDVSSLRTDLNSLRNDLSSLRTEFGTRITAMEGQVKFAMPVHFGFDDAAVRSEDQAALERFAQVAGTHYKGAQITVEGFADPAGSNAYNIRLSRERADAVRDFLVARGLDGATIKTVGYGESRLVRNAQRDQPGAELNRRVTFVVETPNSDATITALSTSTGSTSGR
jgi:peptidoglycan-associated lipoprotein